MAGTTRGSRNIDQLVLPNDALFAFSYRTNGIIDNPFSAKERLYFALRYKQRPGDFEYIAAALPLRTRSDCINYYYANKASGQFKLISKREKDYDKAVIDWDKRKYLVAPPTTMPRQATKKKSVRGKNKQRPENDQEEEADLDVIPINRHIRALRAELATSELDSESDQVEHSTHSEKTILVPLPDLKKIKSYLRSSHTDHEILTWLRSSAVLPILGEWYRECFCSQPMRQVLETVLNGVEDAHSKIGRQIMFIAMENKPFSRDLKLMEDGVILLCAEYAYNLAKANEGGFFREKEFAKVTFGLRCFMCVKLIATAFVDLKEQEHGFFRVLLQSDLAFSMGDSKRRKAEMQFRFKNDTMA